MGAIIVLIIIFLIWRSIAVRAYTAFALSITGFSMAIASLFMEDRFLAVPGFVMMVLGLLISFLSALKHEPSMRLSRMGMFLMYGFAVFMRIACIMIIIGIPIASLFSAMAANYKEVIIVDKYGRKTGRRVTINEDTGIGTDGKKYKKYQR